MKRRICRFLWAATAALILTTLPALALLASADVNGNCSATINGVDVRGLSSSNAGDAIEVKEHTAVPVTMQSPDGITHLRVQIEFAGFPRTVRDEPTSGTSWQNTVPVDDYAKYGVGLYKVIGKSEGPGGSCSGSALVRVVGNPLRTVAGVAAAGITALGGLGLAAAGVASALEGQAEGRAAEERVSKDYTWIGHPAHPPHDDDTQDVRDLKHTLTDVGLCYFFAFPALLLTGAAMAAGGGAPLATEPAVRLRRVGWRPRLSAAGIVGGLLAGAGIVVLLQQYAVVYPTRAVAIEGLVGGLAVGLVIPSLLRFFAVWRVNRAIARAEQRLNESRAKQSTPTSEVESHLDEAPADQTPPATAAERSPDEAAVQQPPDEVAQ